MITAAAAQADFKSETQLTDAAGPDGGAPASPRRAAMEHRDGSYLPSMSILCFSSSFIFLIAGSRLTSPVVWVVVAGELVLGMDVCPVGVFAGRVAVVLGAGPFWAPAGWMLKRKATDSRDAASARDVRAVSFIFIDLLLSDQ
jgi:hypothetical protein